jgi:hypothetical protein
VEQLPIMKISKEAQKPFEILVDYIIWLKANDTSIDNYYTSSDYIDKITYYKKVVSKKINAHKNLQRNEA